ncbi:Peptide release factor-glutamine N5-methyltransferase [Granulibacter bethesdensis]|uniref:peptide chain release factor N(5)-glutamine methyltransferase n=1 Tax=Granulibacter bethesdensis TaxID=364410 RepID=UPI00090C72A4|nr:peptide chain release factor N(5)-glutamine methyltransferase [Granulibacter bethesdensis]APH56412.1 Peptide release factor-glutamine N5-methyltransferase [Granulibacter bethesdensis]
MSETIRVALNRAASALAAAEVESPRAEARLMLGMLLGLDATGLLRDSEREVTLPLLDEWIERRAKREPLAYILGVREFWGLSFAVTPDTLIPRPDTETLIEYALALRPPVQGGVRRVLDLGTGTGCLLLAALHEYRQATGLGIDRKQAVAALARRNAISLGVADRVAFCVGDWASCCADRFDLVLSNPPYIPDRDMAGLMADVRDYEPASALAAGERGMEAYRGIIPSLPDLLTPSGVAILELGIGQEAEVGALAAQAGLRVIGCRVDLGGIARALALGLDMIGLSPE